MGIGVKSEVRDGDGGLDVWALNDSDLDAAREEFEVFVTSPGDARFDSTVQRGQLARRALQEADSAYSKRTAEAKRAVNGAGAVGVITVMLMAISVLVAMASKVGAEPENVAFLFISEFSRPVLPEVREGQVWRLITPIFLHFGYLHLFFNLWWLSDLGRRIENRRGETVFIVMVVLMSVFSNLLQYFWSGPLFGGLSGVVYGLLGYSWAKGRWDPSDNLGLNSQVAVFMMGWLVLCMTGAMGPVANAAHVGGLVFGVAWGWVSGRVKRRI